jgi:Uma2 family endonuclease
MNHELEPNETSTLDSESTVAPDEDRRGSELIDGRWVEKDPDPDEELQETEHKGFELIDGNWIEKPMSNFAAIVGSNLHGRLFNHIQPNRSGLLMIGDAAYRLPHAPENRIRKPDLSFVAAGRIIPTRDEDGCWPIAPDLAVEVISPTEKAEEVEKKLFEYLEAGVRLIWMLYIPTRNVWAHKPDGTAKLYRSSDTLNGEDVLPGFAVPVVELFEGV